MIYYNKPVKTLEIKSPKQIFQIPACFSFLSETGAILYYIFSIMTRTTFVPLVLSHRGAGRVANRAEYQDIWPSHGQNNSSNFYPAQSRCWPGWREVIIYILLPGKFHISSQRIKKETTNKSIFPFISRFFSRTCCCI